MKRSFNYTGRQTIPASSAEFVIRRDLQKRRYFDATIDFSLLTLSSAARVYVEAFHKRSLARFDFGSVADLRAPDERFLDSVDFGERLSFRIRVVDDSLAHDRLLA